MTPNSQLSAYKNEILKSSPTKSNKAVPPIKIDEVNAQKEKEDHLQILLQEKNEELIAQKNINKQAYDL
jgi:hypothetical protein